MFMVLMALVEMGRTNVHRFTRWLWLLLSGGLFVTAPVSCSSTGGGTDQGTGDGAMEEALDNAPQPLYGVDLPLDVVQPESWTDIPQGEYGPPADVSQDMNMPDGMYGPPLDAQDPGPADIPQVLYGPMPVDVQDAGSADMPQVLYGPMPVDVQDAGPADMPQVLYGPMPVDVHDAGEPDVKEDFGVQPMYGPQPLYGVPSKQ